MDKVSMDQELAQEGDSVLSGGVSVLYLFMNLLSELANDKYLEMQAKAKVSRDAQDKANEINEQIAAVSKKGDTGTAAIPDDVIQYMSENDVKVDGKSIEDYLKPQEEGSLDVHITWSNGSKNTQHLELKQGKWTHNGQPASVTKEGDTYIWKDPSGNIYRGSAAHDLKLKPVLLDKGKLEAVKAALENISNRASDFVSQSQLQLQKVMQTYNVTVSLLNSMQTMLEEMNKSIAQNVR
ncbi:MAG: secretion protein EspA [Parashewanella sp.]